MLKKFRPGNHVMISTGGIPMTVTMYADKHLNSEEIEKGEALVCVTWLTLDGKIRTGKFKERMLTTFPLKEWNGKVLQ